MRKLKYLAFAVLILSLGIGLTGAQPYTGSLVITPTPTGQAIITYYTTGSGVVPAPLLGKNATAIQAFTTSGAPLPTSVENGTIFIATNSNASESIVLTYMTTLGWVNGGVVTYEIQSPIPFWLNITNAKIVDMSTAPTAVNGSYWAFPAGNVTVSLLYQSPASVAKNTSTTSSATTASPTPTSTPNAKSESASSAPTTTPTKHQEALPTNSNNKDVTQVAIALLFIGGAMAAYLMTRQPKK